MTAWHGHRRSLLRLAVACLGGGVVGRLVASPASTGFDELVRQAPNGSLTSAARRYTVNATITLAGISLFSKKNVGGAFLGYEQSACADCTVTALQFAAGSWPEKLKGFNRFGMTQEIVREEAGRIAQSAYVSFMSSSPEKNFSEARQAFAAQEVVPLSIAAGRSSQSGCVAEVRHDKVPGNYDWRKCQQIVDHIRNEWSPSAETHAASAALPTFLFAARSALQINNNEPVRYTHNAKFYHLKTRADANPHEGHVAVTGRIFSESDHGETEFKLLLPANDPAALPTRIQWKARSFLMLTLEADAAATLPELRSVLNRTGSGEPA